MKKSSPKKKPFQFPSLGGVGWPFACTLIAFFLIFHDPLSQLLSRSNSSLKGMSLGPFTLEMNVNSSRQISFSEAEREALEKISPEAFAYYVREYTNLAGNVYSVLNLAPTGKRAAQEKELIDAGLLHEYPSGDALICNVTPLGKGISNKVVEFITANLAVIK